MEIPMTRGSANFLLTIIKYYAELGRYRPESPEAVFLVDLTKRLERCLRRMSV